MRKLLNLFKQPIYKDDLKNVLLYGSLNMLFFSALAGALQYFAYISLGLGFSLLIYLISYMIGKEIKERTYSYHILYSVLSVIFFIVGYIIYNVSFYSFLTHDPIVSLQYIFASGNFIDLVFPFLNFTSYSGAYVINYILDIIILIFCIMTSWKLPKLGK